MNKEPKIEICWRHPESGNVYEDKYDFKAEHKEYDLRKCFKIYVIRDIKKTFNKNGDWICKDCGDWQEAGDCGAGIILDKNIQLNLTDNLWTTKEVCDYCAGFE